MKTLRKLFKTSKQDIYNVGKTNEDNVRVGELKENKTGYN